MKRSRLTADPVKAAERRRRREERRASTPPRPEDLRREERRKAAQTAKSQGATLARTATKAKRKPISAASSAQRKAVKDRACLVCAAQPCDPAHVLPRGVLTAGQDDERAVIPLCRLHHSLFEEGKLDALPFLEPHWRDVLAFAVERYGLLRTLEQVTGLRWTPVPQEDR